MSKNRVQVSLTFIDDEVFKELVLPLKEGKELNNFIIKLITRYYKDDRISSLIDEDFVEDESEAENREDIYSRMAESLAALEFLAEQGRDTLEDGGDIFESILSGAEESGVMQSGDENNLGGTFSEINHDIISRANQEKARIEQKEVVREIPNDTSQSNAEVAELKKEVYEMKEMFMSMQAMMQQLMSGSVVKTTKVQDDEENFDIVTEEPISLDTSDVESNDFEIDDIFTEEPIEETSSKPQDGTNDLLSLIGSL